jgi:hypothetical protein
VSDIVERFQDFLFMVAIIIQNVTHLGLENSEQWMWNTVPPPPPPPPPPLFGFLSLRVVHHMCLCDGLV